MPTDAWGTDVVVSAPEPTKKTVRVRFGGFSFTSHGMSHDITEAEREDLMTPLFAPEDFNVGGR